MRQVALHDDLVPAQAAGALPHVHRDRARHLAVDEQLVGRGDDGVGDVGAGQRTRAIALPTSTMVERPTIIGCFPDDFAG